MKIFISSVNTELGYHLVESLRQDHFLLEGFSLISGTIAHQKTSFMIHDSVHQTFDFTQQRDLTVKNAIQSDVIILDLRYDPAPQVQFILKVLKHHTNKKPLKLLGISNFTTWSNTKTTEFTQTPQDKQALLEHTINKHHWQATKLNKTHYPLRVPHPMFVYNYLLEEQILHLKNDNQMVQSVVLCAGLLYGKSGFDLRQHLETALKSGEDWIIGLRNAGKIKEETVIPVLHVNSLMQQVEAIVYGKNDEKDCKQIEEYKVLCQNQPKSLLKIIEKINHLCGNTISQHFDYKPDSTTEQKPPIDTLKLPTTSLNEHPSTTYLTNEYSTRAPTANRNRNLSSQSQLITETLTNVFMPDVTFAKDKVKFAMLMNINFGVGEKEEENGNKFAKGKQKDDTIGGVARQECNPDDNMLEVQQNQSSQQKAWLLTVIQQFTQHFDCDFKRFLLSQEALKQQQNAQNLPQSFMTRYFIIDRNLLIQELNVLVENGVIPQERLATPEEDKKKTNNKNPQNRQSTTKEAYQMVFSELISHVLTKFKLSHFVVCLKAELINKLLSLLTEPEFQEHKHLQFISLTPKQPNPNTQSYPFTQNITKTIELLSEEFYQLYDIENPQTKTNLEGQRIQIDQDEIKKSAQKPRKNIHTHKDTVDEAQELKINLLHQYLLDNLIVYLAEAKHNLKAKGKLGNGQKLEGKQSLKFFVEELKQIRAREMKLACEEQQ